MWLAQIGHNFINTHCQYAQYLYKGFCKPCTHQVGILWFKINKIYSNHNSWILFNLKCNLLVTPHTKGCPTYNQPQPQSKNISQQPCKVSNFWVKFSTDNKYTKIIALYHKSNICLAKTLILTFLDKKPLTMASHLNAASIYQQLLFCSDHIWSLPSP